MCTSPRGGAQHLDDLAARGAAHDRVVDDDHPLALDHRAHRVELELDAEVADRLARLDEGAPDVVVADQPGVEGCRRPPRSERAGTPESGTGTTRRRRSRSRGQPAPRRLRTSWTVRRRRGCPAARSRSARRRSASAPPPGTGGRCASPPVDDDQLAGLDLALEGRADQVQRAGLRAKTTASLSRPSTSGRKPFGSRTRGAGPRP